MKIYKLTLLASFAAFSLTSCEDFLDADNKSIANENADSYFSENPEELRATAYNYLYSLGANISMMDRATDLYINPRGTDDGEFAKFTITPENGDVKSYYTNCYKMINQANALTYYAGADTKLGQEGLFLRNYGYYLLTQQFGAVPYVKEYIQTSSRDYPRVALDEIYPAMLEELKDLYENSQLPKQDHTGVASKQAVAALAAKVALSYAWDCGTTLSNEQNGTYTITKKDLFTNAAAWAEKAINGVQLTMSFEQKWSPSNEGNAEEIWSLQYDRAGFPGDVSSGGHSLMYNYMAYYGDVKTTGMKGTGSGGTDNTSFKSIKMWEEGDQRFFATFMTTVYNSSLNGTSAAWGNEGYLAYYNCTDAEKAKLPIAYKFYPHYYTNDDILADLATLSSQTVKYESGYGVKKPFAALLDGTTCTYWMFEKDGSLSAAESMPTLDFLKRADGGGMAVKKWDDPESDAVTSSNCYRDIVIFHVSDMYLIAAEAYLLADQEANSLEKVNAVRQRAGLAKLGSFGDYTPTYSHSSSFNPTSLDLILDERARELYAERTRFHDLRRTRQLVRYNVEFARSINSVSEMQNGKGETKWYRPIPSTEIANNTSMTEADQNPGY